MFKVHAKYAKGQYNEYAMAEQSEVQELLMKRYCGCYIWNGHDGQIISSQEDIQQMLANNSVVLICGSRYEAHNNLPPLCYIIKEAA